PGKRPRIGHIPSSLATPSPRLGRPGRTRASPSCPRGWRPWTPEAGLNVPNKGRVVLAGGDQPAVRGEFHCIQAAELARRAALFWASPHRVQADGGRARVAWNSQRSAVRRERQRAIEIAKNGDPSHLGAGLRVK